MPAQVYGFVEAKVSNGLQYMIRLYFNYDIPTHLAKLIFQQVCLITQGGRPMPLLIGKSVLLFELKTLGFSTELLELSR